jgi:hypothetical protein
MPEHPNEAAKHGDVIDNVPNGNPLFKKEQTKFDAKKGIGEHPQQHPRHGLHDGDKKNAYFRFQNKIEFEVKVWNKKPYRMVA